MRMASQGPEQRMLVSTVAAGCSPVSWRHRSSLTRHCRLAMPGHIVDDMPQDSVRLGAPSYEKPQFDFEHGWARHFPRLRRRTIE